MKELKESAKVKSLFIKHKEKTYFTKTIFINWILNISTIYFLNILTTKMYDRYYIEGMTMFEVILKANTPMYFLFLFSLNIFFVMIYKLKIPFFEKQKITNLPWPWEQKAEVWQEQLKNLVITYVTNYVIVIFIGHCIFLKFYKVRLDRESYPSFFETWIGIYIFMIFEDFFFYWIHRILHHPYIYEKIHKKHHRYLNLIHLNSVDAHPIEYFFGNFFTTISGSLVMGPRFHFITLLVFGFFRIIEGTETHCGYEFNFSMFKIYPFQIQNSYHSYHHIKNMGNYCIFFSIWDDIFRTNKNFYKAIKDVKMNNTENDKLY